MSSKIPLWREIADAVYASANGRDTATWSDYISSALLAGIGIGIILFFDFPGEAVGWSMVLYSAAEVLTGLLGLLPLSPTRTVLRLCVAAPASVFIYAFLVFRLFAVLPAFTVLLWVFAVGLLLSGVYDGEPPDGAVFAGAFILLMGLAYSGRVFLVVSLSYAQPCRCRRPARSRWSHLARRGAR